MGSNHSVGPFVRDCKIIVNLSLVKIQTALIRFQRTLNKDFDDEMFMDRKQFQWAFELSDIATYKIFSRFDESCRGYVPALDVWGAVVLASLAPTPDKINFLFYMMDTNHDQYLSYTDAEMLTRAVTRGFSKLKALPAVSSKTIHTVLEAIYGRELVSLNEQGEINVRELRSFLAIDDLPRTYFANLGTLLVVEDSSKLIEQRKDLLKDLAVVKAELEEVSRRVDHKMEDIALYQQERGGDVQHVRLTDKALVTSHHKGVAKEVHMEVDKSNKPNTEQMSATAAEEMQRLRRQKRSERLANQDGDSDGSEEWDSKGVFARGCKPAATIGAGGSEGAMRDAMQFKWDMLKPQSQDKLVKLDLDLLLDVLEAAGLTVSDENALRCLREIPANQLGRHNMNDVMVWVRRYLANPPPVNPPFWRKWAYNYVSYVSDKRDQGVKVFRSILRQYDVMKELKRLEEKREKLKQVNVKRQIISKRSMSLQGQKDQFASGSKIKGSQRLATWQKRRHAEHPCTVALISPFGKIQKKAKTEAEKQKDKKKALAIKKAAEDIPDWKTNIKLEVFTKPEGVRRPELLGNDGVLKDLGGVEPLDYMDYFDSFGFKIELTDAEIAAATAAAAAAAAGIKVKSAEEPKNSQKSGSITWFHIPVKESATPEEAYTLLKTSTNFFESIPLDHRHDLYTTVKSQLFYLEGVKLEDNSENPSRPGTSHSIGGSRGGSRGGKRKPPMKYPRLICIALLHDRDPLAWMEDQISASELTFTRSLRKLVIDLNILQPFQEMYEKNCDMEDYPDKLFGPQEDELGEEGMNPLRFAKMCRKRQKAAQEAIQEVPKMSTEDLKRHLKERGYNDRGTRAEMMNLAKVAFAKQAELIGFGELSNFGAGIVEDIFKMFDEDKDGALSVMEFNNLLVRTGSQALYDSKQYKSLLSSEQFHVDNHQRLTLEGLMSYYERYGRLARDVSVLGIRSFANQVAGQLEVRMEYEPDAIGSLLGLMEKKSLSQIFLKRVLSGISSLSDVLYTAKFDRFDDIFKVLRIDKIPFFKEVCEGAGQPGWLSAFLHKKLEFLADEQAGLIPALRKHCKEKFAGFNHFTKAFTDLHNPAVDIDSPRGDMFNSDANSYFTMSTLSMENLGGNDQSTVDDSSTIVSKDLYGVRDVPAIKLTAAEDLKDDKKRKEVLQMMRVYYKPVAPVDLNADDEEPERAISSSGGRDGLTPEVEMWEERLDRLLPRLTGYTHKKTKTVDEINNLLLASSDINKRLGSGERLTRTETDRLHTLKQRYEHRASELSNQLETSVNLSASHFLSFYDALRLYGDGISQVGYGGNNFGMKLHTTGIDWINFLPPGMGEPALRTGLKKEKYERARQRKNAAISAIEREKLRRELDDEERERRRKNDIANAQRIRDDEEKTMFGEVYSGLLGAREEKLSAKETDEFIAQWDKLLNMRERRYPDTLKVAVISNDVGCVKVELCPESDLRLGQALVCFRNAAMIAFDEFTTATHFDGSVTISIDESHKRIFGMINEMEQLEYNTEMDEFELLKKEHLQKLLPVPVPPTFCFDSLRTLIAPHNPAAFFLIFLNYFSVLRKTQSTQELNDSEQQRMKEVLYLIYFSMLNAKERKNIGLERKMELFTVFPFGNIEESLKFTLEELVEHRKAYKKTIDDEELQLRLQEYKGVSRPALRRNVVSSGAVSDNTLALQALALVDPVQAKKMKFKQQMKEAKKKRKISVKQRNKMYEMIASDQISEFFHQQARKADINVVKWGDEEEEKEVDDPFFVSDDSSEDESEYFLKDNNSVDSESTGHVKSVPAESRGSGSGGKHAGSLNDASSIISDTSSLTTPGVPKKRSVMSFLMKGRNKGGT